MALGLKGKACIVQAISSPVFIALAWWVNRSGNASAESSAACKMLLFEGIGQAHLAAAAWNDQTRPNTKEFKDDFGGWVKQYSVSVVFPAIVAMGSFFVQVTGGRFELITLALGGAGSNVALYLPLCIAILILVSVFTKRVPLLQLILACFLAGPTIASVVQWRAGNMLLAASQFLYIINFPLAMARLVNRWQAEILNFVGWFVLAYAVY